jgi:hypothetical protein
LKAAAKASIGQAIGVAQIGIVQTSRLASPAGY